MRPDGTRLRNLTPIVQALPYIMPRRFDAQNWATDYVDEDLLRAYIRQKRREGQHVTHMSVLVAAYYKAALEHPKVNCFVMNRKVYQRNHFCFSFVLLKTRADGTPDETALKIFLEPEDDVFTIARKIIDLSPFHTSLFITNLASINTTCIFHHCYEFGTTGVFICMGRPVPDPTAPEGSRKKLLPLGVVMDERIATGIEYSRFFAAFSRYLRKPEILEQRLDGKVPGLMASKL